MTQHPVHIYSWVKRGTVRVVSCPRTQWHWIQSLIAPRQYNVLCHPASHKKGSGTSMKISNGIWCGGSLGEGGQDTNYFHSTPLQPRVYNMNTPSLRFSDLLGLVMNNNYPSLRESGISRNHNSGPERKVFQYVRKIQVLIIEVWRHQQTVEEAW